MKGADGEIRSDIRYDESLTFEFDYETNQQVTGTSLGMMVYTLDGTCAFTSSDIDSHAELLAVKDAWPVQGADDASREVVERRAVHGEVARSVMR